VSLGGNILDPFCRSASWHYMSVLGHVEHVVINDKSYLHLDGVGREEDKSTTVCTVIVCHRTMHAVQEVKAGVILSQLFWCIGLTHSLLFKISCIPNCSQVITSLTMQILKSVNFPIIEGIIVTRNIHHYLSWIVETERYLCECYLLQLLEISTFN